MNRKSGKNARRLAWMNRELPAKLRHGKEANRKWKQEQVTWEEYRDTERAEMQLGKPKHWK